MADLPKLKSVFRRAVVFFLASLAIFGFCAAIVWWHHGRIAQSCGAMGVDVGPTNYHHGTWIFVSWPEAVALLLLYFGLCILGAWIRSFACRRRAG